MSQQEVRQPSPLLAPDGSLRQRGWSRTPLLDCNLEDAHVYRLARPLQRFRIKRWDYYGVMYPGGYFSATLADLGYAGQAFVYLVDFENLTYVEDTITIPLASGISLARNSDIGGCGWQGKRASLAFDVVGNARTVIVDWDGFAGNSLHAELTFEGGGESTVIATPIGDHRFYYNRKINCMPVAGYVQWSGGAIDVDPTTSSGTLDWGRGVWEYNSFWVWASASGFQPGGSRIGLNLGYGFGDTSAATENTFVLDGRIHKLADVTFSYDNRDFMRPWTMRSDRVDLTFTPFLDRTAKTNLLLIRSEVHQMFGNYTGTVVDDGGVAHRIDGLIGWAEEHHARW